MSRSIATTGHAETTKRMIDVVVSSAALVASAPALAVLGLVVRWRMGPPALFRQQRPGLHGRPFVLLKFRTMRLPQPGREGPEHDAERLTSLGFFLRSSSLDELPTLWNVVRGDMSLVGPRPLLPQYVDRYSPEQARRMHVRPGITGWAQVNGRNALSWEAKFQLDCWYVDHRNLRLDLQILAATVASALRRSGISAAGAATMPEFFGAAPTVAGPGSLGSSTLPGGLPEDVPSRAG